ncbi:hypothetical protein BGZ46_004505 [Entomortierella lignicola]|nr:hypothetical protein BGZ46_004505 [Entomortierella lignicola]
MSSIIPDSDFQGFPSIQIPSSTVTLVHSPQQIHQNRGHQRQQHYSTSSSISVLSSSSGSQYYSDQQQGAALNQRQFKKLISYSSSHKYEAHNNGFRTPNDIGSKDSCSTRLGHIPGWSTYKGRQHSSAKQMVREFLDHEGKLVDCLADEESPIKETIKEECSAWKASFGLFWVAALRNNYIQLPPQGTGLNYYDHYAEGVLYKMSKKSGPVSKLTSNGIRDSAGVWKVSWVVLQGNRLLIYRKSKDTAKESIELLPPLTVTTTMVPDTTHHISMTMITISHTKDPNATKFCFRATSETESNNWVRIFNSLNIETLSEVPPFFSKALANLPIIKPSNIPPPLPPLPVNLPPISRNTPPPLPIKRRERYQSCSSIASKETSVVAGFRKGDQPVYPNERKRFHTTLCASAATSPSPLPSINPVLISNAAAVLSNLNQCFPMSGGIENCDNNIVTDVNRISRNRSVSLRTSGQISLKRDHFRTMSHASTSTLVGSFFNDGFNQLQHHSISRNGSLSSRHQYQFQVDANGSQRQKISTELGHAQRFRVRSMSSELSSQQTLLREYIQRSKDNSSDVPSVSDTPTSDFKEMHLPIEPQSQALLTFSNKRSSASPLYSGYIWMYIPNTQLCASNSLALSTPPTSKHHSISSSESSAPMSKSSSSSSLVQSQNSSTGLKSNICISKASGRYVRCFVVINSLGQFQWVEASKEHEDSDDHTDDQSVNPSFGIQLNPNPVAALQRPKETTHPLRKLSINEKPVLTGPAKGLVQVAMAHKLRLYFFCIKVSISSLSEVMVEMVDAPEADDKNLTRNSSVKSTSTSSKSGYSTPTPHSPPPSLTKKSPLRVNNRLSTPLAHQRAASAMSVFNLPVRSVSLQKPRPRSRTFTHTDGSLKKNNTVIWPSMSRLHERSMSVPMRQTPAFVAPTLKKDSSKTISALSSTKNASADIKLAPAESIELTEQISKRLLAKPQSLFLENRTRSSFSGSIRSRDSTQSDQSALQNDSAAAVISRHESLAKMLRRTTGTLYPSEEDVVAYTIGSAGALKEHPEASHDSKSQVLLLAQSLQKALGQSRGLLDDSAEGILEQEIKPTLHEITAKKRSSIHQQKNSANIEAARLKLVGGRMDSLVESHENTDSITIPSGLSVEMDGQMKESEREKEQEKALRQMAAEIMMQCPFLEKSETCVDLDGRRFVTLKGYTETEEAWKMLQSSLDRFLDGPIKDQRSALPPEDTLIPSYHAPRLPEIRLSEKAQNFLKAKDKAVAAVAAAALLHSGQALDTTPVVNTSATSIAAAAMAATATVTAIGTSISTAATNSMAKTCLSRTNTTASNASTIVAVGAGCSDIRTRRSATLAVFNRHSVPLATGIGYGPRSSFAESINDTEANPKKIERSSLPGCLLVSKSPRKNVIDTPKKVPRVRTESESGAKTLLSVVSSEMKYSHSRSGSGNMFMKQDVSSDYHPQKQQQHTTSGAVAHLKATAASVAKIKLLLLKERHNENSFTHK